MGLFSKKKEPPIVRVEGPKKFALDIVGESHYQTALNQLAGGKTVDGHKLEVDALVFRDDDNWNAPDLWPPGLSGFPHFT